MIKLIRPILAYNFHTNDIISGTFPLVLSMELFEFGALEPMHTSLERLGCHITVVTLPSANQRTSVSWRQRMFSVSVLKILAVCRHENVGKIDEFSRISKCVQLFTLKNNLREYQWHFDVQAIFYMSVKAKRHKIDRR